jgi:hypothetical protein
MSAFEDMADLAQIDGISALCMHVRWFTVDSNIADCGKTSFGDDDRSSWDTPWRLRSLFGVPANLNQSQFRMAAGEN